MARLFWQAARRAAILSIMVLSGAGAAAAAAPADGQAPILAEQVAAGTLPPLADRLPQVPRVMQVPGADRAVYGGELLTLVRSAKDVKLAFVYGYARLVGYGPDYELAPDILEKVDVQEDRVFTLHLRPGHRWSDGHPFTAEDFRYWWDDVANNPELSPSGPPRDMLVEGKPPTFEVLDDRTVRYTWEHPNPVFLPRLAGAAPLLIYRPAHYLKQFHGRYADAAALERMVGEAQAANWAVLHDREDNLYNSDNPDLPSLQPWTVKTRKPAERFVIERNPYFHRVDQRGRQLPYIDRLILLVVNPGLLAAKAARGEADLAARGLTFQDTPLLREHAAEFKYQVRLWRQATGGHIVLYPNLNTHDPVWGPLLRDVRVRRALSLGIDRDSVNEFLFFGLGRPGNNTVMEESPLFEPHYRQQWAQLDLDKANALLDEVGLTARDADGWRLGPDGVPLEIVAETAGEQPEQVDALELIQSDWAKLGIKMAIRPSHRDTLRGRALSGESVLSVWPGLTNGLVTADMPPLEMAPNSQIDFHWPVWGLHAETAGASGAPPDLPEARELSDLYAAWKEAKSAAERASIWQRMLQIHADQVFTIGVVAGVPQPVLVADRLHNVPEEAVYSFDPGAFFGVYNPPGFWLDPK